MICCVVVYLFVCFPNSRWESDVNINDILLLLVVDIFLTRQPPLCEWTFWAMHLVISKSIDAHAELVEIFVIFNFLFFS